MKDIITSINESNNNFTYNPFEIKTIQFIQSNKQKCEKMIDLIVKNLKENGYNDPRKVLNESDSKVFKKILNDASEEYFDCHFEYIYNRAKTNSDIIQYFINRIIINLYNI